MYKIKRLPEFDQWLRNLKDPTTRARLIKRLRRAESTGNLGNIKPVGDGIAEMKEQFGPGWRMYYLQHGEILIIMLGGGDKSTQTNDILQAKALAKQIKV